MQEEALRVATTILDGRVNRSEGVDAVRALEWLTEDLAGIDNPQLDPFREAYAALLRREHSPQRREEAIGYAYELLHLEVGQHFLLRGLLAACHHAVLYEWIKERKDPLLYTVNIHNTGLGVDRYHDTTIYEGKWMANTTLSFRHVPFHVISLSCPDTPLDKQIAPLAHFIEQLWEVGASSYPTADEALFMVYEVLFRRFTPYIAPLAEGYSKMQRSSTCSYRSLLPPLHQLGEVTYKAVQMGIKMGLLGRVCERVASDLRTGRGPEHEETHHVLSEAFAALEARLKRDPCPACQAQLASWREACMRSPAVLLEADDLIEEGLACGVYALSEGDLIPCTPLAALNLVLFCLQHHFYEPALAAVEDMPEGELDEECKTMLDSLVQRAHYQVDPREMAVMLSLLMSCHLPIPEELIFKYLVGWDKVKAPFVLAEATIMDLIRDLRGPFYDSWRRKLEGAAAERVIILSALREV